MTLDEARSGGKKVTPFKVTPFNPPGPFDMFISVCSIIIFVHTIFQRPCLRRTLCSPWLYWSTTFILTSPCIWMMRLVRGSFFTLPTSLHFYLIWQLPNFVALFLLFRWFFIVRTLHRISRQFQNFQNLMSKSGFSSKNTSRCQILGQDIEFLKFYGNFHVFSMIFHVRPLHCKSRQSVNLKNLRSKSVFLSRNPCRCQFLGQDIEFLKFYGNFLIFWMIIHVRTLHCYSRQFENFQNLRPKSVLSSQNPPAKNT